MKIQNIKIISTFFLRFFFLQTDMDKKIVVRLLKDSRLENVLEKNPIPSNTFLKAHFDGLMLVMPDKIMVLKIFFFTFIYFIFLKLVYYLMETKKNIFWCATFGYFPFFLQLDQLRFYSIQYPAPGFEPTTSRLQVFSQSIDHGSSPKMVGYYFKKNLL